MLSCDREKGIRRAKSEELLYRRVRRISSVSSSMRMRYARTEIRLCL